MSNFLDLAGVTKLWNNIKNYILILVINKLNAPNGIATLDENSKLNENQLPFISNANTATKLTNSRKIELSGLVEGEVKFDGSNDVTINTKYSNINEDVINLSGPYVIKFSNITSPVYYEMTCALNGGEKFELNYYIYNSGVLDIVNDEVKCYKILYTTDAVFKDGNDIYLMDSWASYAAMEGITFNYKIIIKSFGKLPTVTPVLISDIDDNLYPTENQDKLEYITLFIDNHKYNTDINIIHNALDFYNNNISKITETLQLHNKSLYGDTAEISENYGITADVKFLKLNYHEASQTPEANKIPITDNNGILQVKSLTVRPFSNNLTSVGWYRVYSSLNGSNYGDNIIFHLLRVFNNASNENYSFSINIGYNNKVSITQLSGIVNNSIISKIRVLTTNTTTNVCYIDIYYNSNNLNLVRVSGIGNGTFQNPVLSNTIPEGYTATEFMTGSGLINYNGNLMSGSVKSIELTNQNLNTLKPDNFIVYYATETNTCSGKPTGVTYFNLHVYRLSENKYTQLLIDNNGIIYKRNYLSTSGYDCDWTEWVKMADVNSNVASADKLNIKQLTNENLNNIKDDYAVYYCSGGSVTNIPDSIKNRIFFNLIVYRTSGVNGQYVQILTHNTGTIYKRYCLLGAWHIWEKIATVDDSYYELYAGLEFSDGGETIVHYTGLKKIISEDNSQSVQWTNDLIKNAIINNKLIVKLYLGSTTPDNINGAIIITSHPNLTDMSNNIYYVEGLISLVAVGGYIQYYFFAQHDTNTITCAAILK